MFLSTAEDDQAEDRIDSAMERTAQHVGTLNSVARLMQKEIDSQDNLIGRLGEKVSFTNPDSSYKANLDTERFRQRSSQIEYREIEAHPLNCKGRTYSIIGIGFAFLLVLGVAN